MTQAFCPEVGPLEGRFLLSANLKGTLKGIGPPTLIGAPASPSTVTLRFFLSGKIAKQAVAGDGFLLTGASSYRVAQGYDYIEFGTMSRKSKGSSLSMSAVTPLVISGSPQGPVTLEMQVTKASGSFA